VNATAISAAGIPIAAPSRISRRYERPEI
jgi:hypothetical protein